MKVGSGRALDVIITNVWKNIYFVDLNARYLSEGTRNEKLCIRMLFRIECGFQ